MNDVRSDEVYCKEHAPTYKHILDKASNRLLKTKVNKKLVSDRNLKYHTFKSSRSKNTAQQSLKKNAHKKTKVIT